MPYIRHCHVGRFIDQYNDTSVYRLAKYSVCLYNYPDCLRHTRADINGVIGIEPITNVDSINVHSNLNGIWLI